ncbi:MAG: hypothetical protein Q7T55_07930 [Solirubrobacteraceae bacterium]|nr:hypothetical protein [Solirubrobacteraceae bacterium]
MLHPARLLSTLAATAALSAATAGLVAAPAPAAAAASCQVNGGSSMGDSPNEWSVMVTFLAKGVTCKQAKAVINQCGSRNTVPGWKFTQKPSTRFVNRSNPKRRFVVMLAGGSPQCISKAMGY